MKNRAGLVILLWVFGVRLAGAGPIPAGEEFSRDRALEHLRVLSETIGPRPLGTPQEKAALTYFAEKLAEVGCRIEWQPVSEAIGGPRAGGFNTKSFNVIGRLPGTSPREIVVGAHIDSSGPEIPGTNDDASGVATIIELARVSSLTPRDATLVFAAFCGEESGLVGSKSFVEQYPLENVALMLQLDMVSDDSPLLLFVDTRKSETPPWLVSASIDAFHSLGYRNIRYPTFFQNFNAPIGGAGSDHEPFLEKGIPAIGFVTDLNNPIHTPDDSLRYFQADGLERSGRLIQALLEKFDDGQPEEKSGHYVLVLIGERPLFVPLAGLKVVIILSLVAAIGALIRLFRIRKSQVDWEEDKKIRKSWPKLLILNLIIVGAMVSSLWLGQKLKGSRIPWYAHPGPYVLYAGLFFVLGIWLSLQLTRRWKLRRNSFFYFVRASIYLAVLTGLAWLAWGPRLAFLPAAGLLFISLAGLVPWSWLKGLLWLLAPFWIFRSLVYSEAADFIFRSAAVGLAALKTPALSLLFWTGLALFFVLWTMPFLLGFAAVQRSARGDLWGLKGFRRPMSLIPIGILIIGGALALRTVPAFQAPWEREVKVSARLDAQGRTAVEFSSYGNLEGIRAAVDGREVVPDGRRAFQKIEMPLQMDWLKEQVISRTEEKGGQTVAHVRFELDFDKPPFTVNLTLQSDRRFEVAGANVKYQTQKNRAAIRWAYSPGPQLMPEMDIRLAPGARLDAEIKATFLDAPVSVSCAARDTHITRRAEIVRRVRVLGGN
jgi:hypothetical protein